MGPNYSAVKLLSPARVKNQQRARRFARPWYSTNHRQSGSDSLELSCTYSGYDKYSRAHWISRPLHEFAPEKDLFYVHAQ